MIMAEGKKLSRTTLEEKLMIIDYFKKSNKTQNETVEHFKDQFSISSSSFSEWLRNEEELRQRYMKALNGPSSAANLVIRSKRRATYKYGPINDAMFEAVTERIQNNLPITQPILRKYWMKFAKQYGVTDPKRMDCFSHGWLENFKKRLGLTRLNGTLKELNNNGKNMGEHDISSGKRRFDELMDVQRENATENEPYTGNTNGKRQGQCGKRRCLQTGSPATQFDLIKASSDYTTVNFSDVAQNTIARNKEAAVDENSKTNGQKNDNSNRNDNTITNNTKNMNIGTSVDNKNINGNNGDVSGNSNEKNKINNGGSGNAGDISGSNPEKGKQSHTHSHAKTKTGIHNRSNLQQILMNPDNNKSPYLISNLNALGYEKSSLNKMADYRTDENINNKISGRILTNTNDIPLQPSYEINSSSTQLQSYAMDPFSNSTNNTKFRQMLSVSGGTTNDLLKHKIQEQSLSFDENLVMLAPLPPIPPSMNAIANNKHIGRLGIPYKLDDNESIENAIRKAGNLNNPKNNNIKGDNATSETTINFDSGNSIKCSIDDMERLLFIYADQFFKQFKTTSLFKESREVFEEFKTKFMTDKIAYLAQNKR